MVSWSARARRGSRAESIETSVLRRQTRNSAPRAPSRLPATAADGGWRDCVKVLSSRSGAILRSQPVMRMADASLMFWERRLAIKDVVICCMASSACA